MKRNKIEQKRNLLSKSIEFCLEGYFFYNPWRCFRMGKILHFTEINNIVRAEILQYVHLFSTVMGLGDEIKYI